MRRDAKLPHAAPQVIAVTRGPTGRQYHSCVTRAQALAHHPYLIEHVNGFGQVTHRERLPASTETAK